MAFYDIVFYAFAFVILVSAGGVVFSKRLMYSAFSLLFTFFGVAGFYVLLHGDFIAVTQIMIYIGGILVLIIFGVMLTTRINAVEVKSGTTGKVHIIMAALITIVIVVFLALMYSNVKWFENEYASGEKSTTEMTVEQKQAHVWFSESQGKSGPESEMLPDSLKLESSISLLGKSLISEYLLAFEVAAVLLLIAFIGAALIARRN